MGQQLDCKMYCHNLIRLGIVTIVKVNDASIERYGRWDRWPRTLHADLIAWLNEAGAKAIVFDFVFDTVTEDDAVLAAAIEQAGNVVQPVLGVGDAIHDQADMVRYEQQGYQPRFCLRVRGNRDTNMRCTIQMGLCAACPR